MEALHLKPMHPCQCQLSYQRFPLGRYSAGRRNAGAGNVLHLELAGGSTGMCMCKNSLNMYLWSVHCIHVIPFSWGANLCLHNLKVSSCSLCAPALSLSHVLISQTQNPSQHNDQILSFPPLVSLFLTFLPLALSLSCLESTQAIFRDLFLCITCL